MNRFEFKKHALVGHDIEMIATGLANSHSMITPRQRPIDDGIPTRRSGDRQAPPAKILHRL
jgi:hypothetical protein